MHIKELSIAEFDSFAENFMISSYYQSSSYAIFMTERGYDYEFIGYVDELGVIKAAALILLKKIGLSSRYGYSPKGFLIDYFDHDLLKNFVEALRKYYEKKLVFIKINPEIAIGEIDPVTKITNYNHNIIVRDYLKELGFLKLKDNKYFESLFPRYNAIINTQEYNFHSLNKNTKNKIRKGIKRGLAFEKKDRDSLDIFYEFIKNQKDIDAFYYKNYYNVFDRNHSADLFLVKIDFEQYLLNSKKLYDEEQIRNSIISEKLIHNSNEANIKEKMNSDRILLSYKNDIEIATKGLRDNKEIYIAGAFVIRYLNRVHIAISGYNPKFRNFDPNYFLHYKILLVGNRPEHIRRISRSCDFPCRTAIVGKPYRFHRLAGKWDFRGVQCHVFVLPFSTPSHSGAYRRNLSRYGSGIRLCNLKRLRTAAVVINRHPSPDAFGCWSRIKTVKYFQKIRTYCS